MDGGCDASDDLLQFHEPLPPPSPAFTCFIPAPVKTSRFRLSFFGRYLIRTASVVVAGAAICSNAPAAPRPNIILILADDLGYSDISPYGGEVRTPNLQTLADNGVRFRNFYNTARCCPTRASLLTGLHPHEAGIGLMTSEDEKQNYDLGHESYTGYLNRNGITLAEALKGAGYRTLMAGKWHVGTFRGMWPRDRGFDRFYGIVRGASNFFKPEKDKLLTLDDEPVDLNSLPDDYYTTTAFTDHAIEFVQEAVRDYPDQPFFLYLAYTAPHWPLQAPEKYVEHYRKLYEQGWDALRPKRIEGVIRAGVIPSGTPVSDSVAPRWDSLPEAKRREMAHRMALYAGMIEAMDENIGRLLAELRKLGVYDDTLIVFLSDNGGCAEGGMLGSNNGHLLGTKEGYFLTLGEAWANYANIPFDKYKHFTAEGGIRTPFIAHWPKGISARGKWSDQIGGIVDFMPTFLALAGAKYPASYDGHNLLPIEGINLAPALTGAPPKPRKLFFEHEGNKAIFDGDWKLVSTHGEKWRLHNLRKDPTEKNDLSSTQADRAESMRREWRSWADRVGVLAWPAKRRAGYTPPERQYPVQLP